MRTEKARHTRRSEAGFSLIELMVVILIMSLLAAVIFVNVAPVGDRSRVAKARADIATLEGALEQYSLDMYRYPSEADGLEALSRAPAGANEANYRPGGYIRRIQLDPWGNSYQYANPSERSNAAFDLYSLGADGQVGGEEMDADIGNWE